MIQRFIQPSLLFNLKVSPIVFLNGARQAGKSTLVLNNLREIGKDGTEAAYITFDNATQMAAATAAPEAFLSFYENTLVLDEVQMVPEIFRALKLKVDSLRIENKAASDGRYSRAGNLINDADLSRGVGLNAVTGKFYRNILKMMFLTIDVPPWYRNIGKRLVKSAKGYIGDTLFLCYILGLKIEEIVKKRPDLFGHILENFVAMELTKLLSFSDSRAKLYHFRTSDGTEVDFVLEKPDGNLWAIEVKNSDQVTARDFDGLKLRCKYS